MRPIFLLVFSLLTILTSCTDKGETQVSHIPKLTVTLLDIPNNLIDKSELHYNNKTSLWTLDNQLFSGHAVSYHKDGTLIEKIGILNGKKENQTIQWFPDGQYRQVAYYHKGKLNGQKKVWSPDTNHVLLSQLNYLSGKAHGKQKKWYPTGELYQSLNLNMGREEGLQQAFRQNGELYANYEAKNGRIFGLKKASLCFGLENGSTLYEK